MSTTLSTAFRQAGIPLDLLRDPIRPVNRDIVQLDIAREPAERVRLWPGAADNAIEPLSIDASLAQLVLAVKEPRRPYEDRIRIRGGRVSREQIEAFVRESGGGRVLRPRGSSWLVERHTEAAERRFLVGFDQRHLFAAQIPSGETVREAHEALMPADVRAANGEAVRQGEWFFVPATRAEETEVRERSRLDRRFGWDHRLPGAGEPHWAETLVRLPGGIDPETGWRSVRHFVRGRVHHRDHTTVCFDRWRRVHLNAAVRRRSERARGFYWID